MKRGLVVSRPSPLVTLSGDVERARSAVADARSRNTLEAYGRAWRSFRAWGKDVLRDEPRALDLPAPPEVVAVYLGHLAEARRYKPATLDLHLAAIVWGHRRHGTTFDRRAMPVADTRAGLRRQIGVAQRKARPLMPEDLEGICADLGWHELRDVRDRAILLVSFAGAFRSSELLGALSGLRVGDCKRTKEGYELTVRRSKTDQEGAGVVKYVVTGRQRTCPVLALDTWLRALKRPVDAPLFIGLPHNRRPSEFALHRFDLQRIIVRLAARAGLSIDGLSGHSPRAGLVTAAVEAGVAVRDIQQVTGHKDVNVLEGYVRRNRAKVRPAAKGLL